jgi:hypothetical protein
MIPAPVVIILGAHMLVAAAEQVPTIDVAPGCRTAATALGIKMDVDACIRSEQNAREQLVKEWSGFPAADREGCYSLTRIGGNGTYTDLLTCLEIKRDARLLPKEPGLVGQGGR